MPCSPVSLRVDGQSESVLDYCQEHKIGFIPWFPIASGKLAQPGDPVAKATGDTPARVPLAWLLRRSPVMLPIPGTSTTSKKTARRQTSN
jgi:pyridoxine 4-dehydrogenase